METPAIPNMPEILRVAVLVDLPRSPQSGGHVKCWERLADAASNGDLPLDLTVYFSGRIEDEILGPKARFRQLPAIFSTSYLKFLPYMPDTTDLAPYHPKLARSLCKYDVIHTTDGFFAFSQTAERISRKFKIPMVTSFHTDTLSYTRIFTSQTINNVFKKLPKFRDKLLYEWNIPEQQARRMAKKLKRHVSLCRDALVTRKEDYDLAETILGKAHAHHLRLGVNKNLFNIRRRDHKLLEQHYSIPPGRIVILFVGRVDVGKNIYTLLAAMEKLVAAGLPLHLLIAGVGPATDDIKNRLKDNATILGFVKSDELASLYASVDLLALCSEVEIRSMVGVEAMASGCPALVSEKSGVAELFHFTAAMQIVKSGIDNWTDAIRAFVLSPEKQAAMRQAAVTYSKEHLASWYDVLADDLFMVWKKAYLEQKKDNT